MWFDVGESLQPLHVLLLNSHCRYRDGEGSGALPSFSIRPRRALKVVDWEGP